MSNQERKQKINRFMELYCSKLQKTVAGAGDKTEMDEEHEVCYMFEKGKTVADATAVLYHDESDDRFYLAIGQNQYTYETAEELISIVGGKEIERLAYEIDSLKGE